VDLKLVLCVKGRSEAERVGEEHTEGTGFEREGVREAGEDYVVRSFVILTPLQVL
jgi:hypothetical protein